MAQPKIITDTKKIGDLTQLQTTNKSNLVNAVNEINTKAIQAETNAKAYTDTAPEAMQRNLGKFNVYKSGKDSNGIFTTVDYKRADGTLYARSVLSGGVSPQYTTRTITYYDTNGTTVLRTETWTITYDSDGDVVNEVKS